MLTLSAAAPPASPGAQSGLILATLAVQSLASPSSRRNYLREISRFITTGHPLTREGIQSHLNRLRSDGAGEVTRNVALAAIRLLAREAHMRHQLSDSDLGAIERIKTQPIRGQKLGRWLTHAETTLVVRAALEGEHGTRNGAIVAAMIGCGLRRAEAAGLDWSQWQSRDGRAMWVDVRGKGQRTRSIPCARWAADLIERWHAKSGGAAAGKVFPVVARTIYQLVAAIGDRAGIPIRPHDLRRTSAKLMRAGGASLEQISAILGHGSVKTTEIYLGTRLEIAPGEAATDKFEIDWKGDRN